MVLTFDSLEEVLVFAQKFTGVVKAAPAKKEAAVTEPEPKEKPNPEPEVTTEPEQEPEPEDTKSEAVEEEQTEEVTYSLVDVRAVLAEAKKKSGSAALKSLLDSFGAAKLSEVNPEDYADLIKKAGEL